MNTVLVANPSELALELMQTQRNTLLQPTAAHLVHAVAHDEDITSWLLGLTVFEDCIGVIYITELTKFQETLSPEKLILIAQAINIDDHKVIFYENPMGNNYNPNVGISFYPTENEDDGTTNQRPLFISIPPFNKFSILKQ